MCGAHHAEALRRLSTWRVVKVRTSLSKKKILLSIVTLCYVNSVLTKKVEYVESSQGTNIIVKRKNISLSIVTLCSLNSVLESSQGTNIIVKTKKYYSL